MTNQEFFDKAVEHLRKQGKRANMPGAVQCQYTSGEGLHCAVGGVMSPELRRLVIERGLNSSSIQRVMKASELAREELGGVNCQLLRDMQLVHDSAEPADWEQEFQTVAKNFGLKYKEPA